MDSFDYTIVEEAAKQCYIKALCDLPPDVRAALKKAYERETQPAARSVFEAMFKAIEIADSKKTLLCQDTGLPIYKVRIGSARLERRENQGRPLRRGQTRHPGVSFPQQFHPHHHPGQPPDFGGTGPARDLLRL